MASSQLFIILAILSIFAPSIFATDFIVGDDSSWTIKFDYQAWAKGKQFYVGDNLVFKYLKGVHNVLKVNGTGFQQCSAPADSVALTSGNDVINLATPGSKRYICGVAQHCQVGGQKILITVLSSSSAPSPSPFTSTANSPSPSASIPYTSAATTTSTVGTRYGWMVVVMGFLAVLDHGLILDLFPNCFFDYLIVSAIHVGIRLPYYSNII